MAKKMTAAVIAAGMCMSMGCGDAESPLDDSKDNNSSIQVLPTWDNPGDGQLLERPKVSTATRLELLSDLNFSRGFDVTLFHSNSSNGVLAGNLDYAGNKAEGDNVWRMAQWGCTTDMVEKGEFTREGSVLTYDDGAKFLKIDAAKTGAITLGIKGSVEYPLDEEGNIRDRLDSTENWPHILIEQGINHAISADCDRLYMEIKYCVNECTSLVDRNLYPMDPNLHAAQFQWFITLGDNNPESVSYGNAMWFGFSMFDTRAIGGTPSGMSAYDGGKEDSTGLFIYMPSLEAVAQVNTSTVTSLPSSVVGKEVYIKFDILPFLKQALKIARQQGALLGATVDHLTIGSTNIGWELPGNYDTSVTISYLNMYEEYDAK